MNEASTIEVLTNVRVNDAAENRAMMDVLFLGISGVLHPSRSMYLLVRGSLPSSDGHQDYEGVPVLVRALAPYPRVRIVLTSTQPSKHGLAAVKALLGPALGDRVDGFALELLTSGGEMSVEDYWRLDKAGIVAASVQRLRPRAWAVVDDENILWPTAVRESRLVRTDPCEGLLDSSIEDRLLTVFAFNFVSDTNEAETARVMRDRWIAENEQSLASSDKYVDQHGLPLGPDRNF